MSLKPVWKLAEVDPDRVLALARELEDHPLVATLLFNRGITEADEARRFLRPRLADLPDPFTMLGMREGVGRVMRALESGERIGVWGDYDVDGVTSASQLVWFFRELDVEVTTFVPDRFADGYGLNADRIRELAESGVQLLLTVDCGISNVQEVQVANELGMDVVIIDHHKVPPEVPPAFAILNPMQEACAWPDRRLAACGVTWVFLVGLRKALREAGWFQQRPQPDLREWLDLTAIGTVADVVPLQGVNRAITLHGLHRLATARRPGVHALCEVSKLRTKKITAGTVGFQLGPRINAAGRVAHAKAGLDLLTETRHEAAEALAKQVDVHNVERKGIQETILKEAMAMAADHPDPESRRVIVLAKEGWHTGVLGIVASKVRERFHRPTLLMTIEDGLAKGSARSIGGFKLVDHLHEAAHLLQKYGGHDHAAGVTMDAANVDALREALDASGHVALKPKHLVPVLRIDADVPHPALGWPLVDLVQRLWPYGKGNPEPLLMARNIRVMQSRVIGNDQTHLKMVLEGPQHPLEAIAFGQAEDAPLPGQHIDIAFVPDTNVFRGEERFQLRVKALRLSEA